MRNIVRSSNTDNLMHCTFKMKLDKRIVAPCWLYRRHHGMETFAAASVCDGHDPDFWRRTLNWSLQDVTNMVVIPNVHQDYLIVTVSISLCFLWKRDTRSVYVFERANLKQVSHNCIFLITSLHVCSFMEFIKQQNNPLNCVYLHKNSYMLQ